MRPRLFPSLFALILISFQLVSTSHAAPFAYIVNRGSNLVSVVDTASNTVTATIPVGSSPVGVTVNPAGTKVYVSNSGEGTVSVIDTGSNEVVKTVAVGSQPHGIAATPDGSRVYVCNHTAHTVSVIETAGDTVSETVDVGNYPHGVVVNAAGTRVYVSNSLNGSGTGTVSVIDTADNSVTTPITAGSYPSGMVVSLDGSRLYMVNHNSHNVSVINTADYSTVATIPVGSYPFCAVLNPTGSLLYVSNFNDNTLSVIETAGNSFSTTIPGVGAWPFGLSMTPDGSRLYVGDYGSNTVTVVNMADNSIVTAVTTGSTAISYGNFIASPPPITNGLVSLWRGEGNALDAFGGNHGAWSGSAAYASGKTGNAFSFNGSTSHVAAGDMDNTALSVSFWFKRNSMPHTCGGLVTKMLDGDLSAWAVYLNGNRIHVRTDTTGSGQQYLESSTVFSSNQWYHIAFVYDNVNVRLYVNGVLDQTQPAGAVLNGNNHPLTLGSGANGGNLCEQDSHFDGLIDEPAIFNRALTAGEIAVIYNTGSGNTPDQFNFIPVTGAPLSSQVTSNPATVTGISASATISISAGGEYRINSGDWTTSEGNVNKGDTVMVRLTSSSNYSESKITTLTIGGVNGAFSVTTAAANDPNATGLIAWWEGENNPYDSIGNHNGAWTGTPDYATGEAGKAFRFNGTSEVTVPAFNMGDDWTIAAWVNPHSGSDSNTHCPILARSDGNQDGLLFTYLGPGHGSANQFALDIGNGSGWPLLLYSGSTYSMDQWHHVVASKSGDTYTLFVDGVLKGQQTVHGISSDYQSKTLEIGHWYYGSHAYTNGRIDEMKIFNRALTAKEVLKMYDPNGPVAWWKGENNPLDSIGDNDGALQGSATFPTGKEGQAFSLSSATHDGVTVPSSAALNPTEAITMSAWIKPNALNNPWPNIISKRLDSGAIQYSITISNRNTFTCDITGAGVSAEGGAVPLNQWSHVACTYDRNTLRLYVNGEQVATAPGSAAIATGSEPLTIGMLDGDDTRNFDGLIDEVKIYNRALTATEVANSYGLVSWWKGENNALDSIGGNHGTLQGGADFEDGWIGRAFSFDGTDDYVDAGTSDAFNFNNGAGDFTIKAWIKMDSMPAFASAILGKATHGEGGIHSAPFSGWAFYIYSDGRLAFGGAGVWEFYSSTGTLVAGNWNHVAVTKNGGTYKLYANGQEVGSTTFGDLQTSTTPLRIGSTYSDALFFDGLIDEVKIFNRTLSADEIADNWPGFAATNYAGGDGSAESPFMIATAPQLAKLAADASSDPASSAGKYFSLTEDIDLAGHQWTPIPEFRGTFDGRGHRILNLTIGNSGADYQGLFGQINSGASISNLGVVNANIVGGTYNGAIAGFASSATVTGCYSTGTVTGYSGNGGLVGGADTALTLSYSWSSCAVTGSAAVEGRAWSGGLVGPVWNGTATISNSFATGAVVTVQNSGGLVALNHRGNLTITNCFVTGNVITSAGSWNNVGGIVGLVGNPSSTTITNCYHSGMISGSDSSQKTGGIIGGSDGGTITVNNSYYNSANAPGQGCGIPLSTSNMGAAGFVTSLNSSQNPQPWLFDSGNTNNGFPILAGMPGIINFISQTGVPLSTPIISNPITVRFIGDDTPISVTGGEYSLSDNSGLTWGLWSSTGVIDPNDQVRVRQTSSAGNSETTTASLTIGGSSGDFTVTTATAEDPNATGLVSWWKGENNALDSVGGNHGTDLNGTSYGTGQAGQAFSFDGTDDNVRVPHSENLNLAGSQTIQLWAYFNTLSQPLKIIVQKGIGTSDAQFYFRTSNLNGLDLSVCNGSYNYYFQSDVPPYTTSFSALGITERKWHHIAMVVDAPSNTARIYVDGVEKTAVAGIQEAARSQNSADLTIGGFSWNNNDGYFNGLIDEVKIFNRALSAAEVSRLAGTYPDVFSFPDKNAANLGTLTESDAITVTCITQPAPISINVGMYSVSSNGTNWSDYSSTTPATVSANDQVKVRLTSSSSYGTTTTATLNIGGREGTFSVTTKADNDKPFVTAFTLIDDESTTMTVSVATFTATDISGVTGYMVTSSSTPPLASDTAWSETAPTTYTLTTAGTNTLYAWAKDQAGNVSDSATATVTLKPVLRGTSTYYTSMQTACGDASSGETVKALAVTVPGNVTITGKTLTIKGGHADGYGDLNRSTTTIQGTLTIGTGTLIVDRVAIR